MIQSFQKRIVLVLVAVFIWSSSDVSAIPNVTCPGNFSSTYSNQTSLNETFADYLRAIFATEDGCPITSMTDLSTFSPPSFTGGCTTIVFEATDCDGTNQCTAVFTAIGPDIPSITPICPGNMTLTSCTSDEEANAAFQTWLEGFSHSGGCDVTTTDLSIYSPPGCGGTTEVRYEVSSMGLTIGCTATFAIPAEVSAPDPSIVPTMGEWGIICLFLILIIVGAVHIRVTSSGLHTSH